VHIFVVTKTILRKPTRKWRKITRAHENLTALDIQIDLIFDSKDWFGPAILQSERLITMNFSQTPWVYIVLLPLLFTMVSVKKKPCLFLLIAVTKTRIFFICKIYLVVLRYNDVQKSSCYIWKLGICVEQYYWKKWLKTRHKFKDVSPPLLSISSTFTFPLMGYSIL